MVVVVVVMVMVVVVVVVGRGEITWLTGGPFPQRKKRSENGPTRNSTGYVSS